MSFNYAALVVTYNRKDKLRMSIEKLMMQELAPSHILVVDNNSTDDTEKMMTTKFRDSTIVYIRLSENVGGAGGFAAGINEFLNNPIFENDEWIALSDDDTYYDSKYFDLISKQTSLYPEIKSFAGVVFFPDGEIQYGHRKFITNWIRMSSRSATKSDYDTESFLADFASFVGLVVNRNILERVGLPDKDYFIWNDDFEYNLRILAYTQVLVLGSAKIIHDTQKELHGHSKTKIFTWKDFYGVRNRYFVVQAHSKKPVLGQLIITMVELKNAVLALKYGKTGIRIFRQYLSAISAGMRGQKGISKTYYPGMR